MNVFGEDWDDIFRMMDGMMGKSYDSTSFIDYNASERIISDDNIYYTLVTREIEEDDIKHKVEEFTITLYVNVLGDKDSFTINVPYRIIPEKTEFVFTCYRNLSCLESTQSPSVPTA